MNEVGVDDDPGPRADATEPEQRRQAGGMERGFQRAIGFDQKVRQYDAGEAFVRGVVERVGVGGLNRVWERVRTCLDRRDRRTRALDREGRGGLMARPPAVARVPRAGDGDRARPRARPPRPDSARWRLGRSGLAAAATTLHALRRLLKLRLEVVHVDHRLREGSAADAAYVRRRCDRLRVPFHLRVADGEPARGNPSRRGRARSAIARSTRSGGRSARGGSRSRTRWTIRPRPSCSRCSPAGDPTR